MSFLSLTSAPSISSQVAITSGSAKVIPGTDSFTRVELQKHYIRPLDPANECRFYNQIQKWLSYLLYKQSLSEPSLSSIPAGVTIGDPVSKGFFLQSPKTLPRPRRTYKHLQFLPLYKSSIFIFRRELINKQCQKMTFLTLNFLVYNKFQDYLSGLICTFLDFCKFFCLISVGESLDDFVI